MRHALRPILFAALLGLAAFGADHALRAATRPRRAAPAPAAPVTTPTEVGKGAARFTQEFSGRDPGVRLPVLAGLFPIHGGAYLVALRDDVCAYAGDLGGGRLRWSAAQAIRAPAGARGGVPCLRPDLNLIFLPLGPPGVVALDDRSLAPVWTTPLPAPVEQSVCSGGLVIAAGGATVAALDPLTGAVRWTYAAPGSIRPGVAAGAAGSGAPTVSLVCGTPATFAARLVALDGRTGVLRWERERPPGASAPAVGGGRVLVASDSASGDFLDVTSIDLDSGVDAWHVRLTPAGINLRGRGGGRRTWFPPPPRRTGVGRPAVIGGAVYVPVDGGLVCLDAATGGHRWACSLPASDRRDAPPHGGAVGPPALVRGRLYAATGNGGGVAIDPASGRVLWRFESDPGYGVAPGPTDLAPVADEATLFLPNDRGFAAFSLARIDPTVAPVGIAIDSTARPVPPAALWAAGGFVVSLVVLGVLVRRPRLVAAALSLCLLSATVWLWFDSYLAARFVGRKAFVATNGHTAETRWGVGSRAGGVEVGRAHTVWADATRPPPLGDSSAAGWATRSPLDTADGEARVARFGVVSAARSSGTDLGPHAVAVVRVPHWFLATVFALAPCGWLSGRWRDRRRYRPGCCAGCGYDLRGLGGGDGGGTPRCPECGLGKPCR